MLRHFEERFRDLTILSCIDELNIVGFQWLKVCVILCSLADNFLIFIVFANPNSVKLTQVLTTLGFVDLYLK